MGMLFVYILKVSICLIFFYIFFKLLLSRETFFKFNRYLILSIFVLSFILPLVIFTKSPIFENVTLHFGQPSEIVADSNSVSVSATQLEINNTVQYLILGLCIIYFIGIIVSLIFTLVSYKMLFKLLFSGDRRVMRREGGIELIIHNRNIAPLSWMNYIAISEKDFAENGQEIYLHEKAHVENRHSYDLLIAEIVKIINWFNPASYLLLQELKAIHEYQADKAVIDSGIDMKSYQLLLIRKAVGDRLYSIANSFNHSKLKNRITMIAKRKSKNFLTLKALFVLPLSMLAIATFASNRVTSVLRPLSEFKVINLEGEIIKQSELDTEITVPMQQDTVKKEPVPFALVEIKPAFQGGDANDFTKWVNSHMTYPEQAKKDKIQGTVIIEFIVNTEGKVQDVKIIRGVDKSLDDEATRVILSSPDWVPGKIKEELVPVIYKFPVRFQLR